MENTSLCEEKEFTIIFEEVRSLIITSRNKVYITVNVETLRQILQIGKIIMEIQDGEERAGYSDKVLDNLSLKLTSEFGKGFSSRNLRTMRKFYFTYQNWQTVSSKLSWSHYLELIKVTDEKKRNFYMIEAINTK